MSTLTPAGTVIALSNSAAPGQPQLGYTRGRLAPYLNGRRIAHLPFATVRKETDFRALHAAVRQLGASITTLTDPHLVARELARHDTILISGGNTFLLLATLDEHGLIGPIHQAVHEGSTYIGISAGTNITSPTIATTNSMPIVATRSLSALSLLPIQLNVHYPGPSRDPEHSGESRDERIREYLHLTAHPVLALRESSWLVRDQTSLHLHGAGARLFLPDNHIEDYPDSDISHLLDDHRSLTQQRKPCSC